MKNKKRIEFDSIGSKKIDENKLWGAQTQRSLENFKIGREKIPTELMYLISDYVGTDDNWCYYLQNKRKLI